MPTIFRPITRRQWFALLGFAAATMVGLVAWLTQSGPATPPIAWTLVGCTNVTARGVWQPFTLAHFRVTNRENATLVCALGPVEYLIEGAWVADTNRLLVQYGSTLRPKETILMDVALPPQATRLRTSFRTQPTPAFNQTRLRLRLEQLLQKLGVRWRPRPVPPIIQPCEAAIE